MQPRRSVRLSQAVTRGLTDVSLAGSHAHPMLSEIGSADREMAPSPLRFLRHAFEHRGRARI